MVTLILLGLEKLISRILFLVVVKGLLKIIKIFYQFFSIFAGLEKISYDGSKTFLINVFVNSSIVSKVYIGMACIGIIMIFFFAIIAVIRKIFDMEDKYQRPLSNILKNCFKGIFVIFVLNLAVTGVLNGSNVLLQSVAYTFSNAQNIGAVTDITFTDDQYALMARVLDTIGNYSLNPSYDSRYNINSCFNEIREDMYELALDGVFDGHYVTVEEDGTEIQNWMTALQEIAVSTNLTYDLDIDIYYESVSVAITHVMDILRTNPNLPALRNYTFATIQEIDSNECLLDRVIFLIGTMGAANNSDEDSNESLFFSSSRMPFYTGEKDMYSYGVVGDYFDTDFLGGLHYILMAVLGYFTLMQLFKSTLICASRLFLLTAFYITAPPFIATMPWDDGEKFKQWTQGFIIQCFSVFGTVVPMRIIIILIPVVLSDRLVLFPDSFILDAIAKLLIVLGGLVTVDSFSGILNGILSGNVGAASAMANEKAGAMGGKAFGVATAAAKTAGKVGFSAAKTVGGAALKGLANVTGATALGKKALGGIASGIAKSGLIQKGAKMAKGYSDFVNGGGLGGMAYRAIKGKMNGSKDTGTGSKGPNLKTKGPGSLKSKDSTGTSATDQSKISSMSNSEANSMKNLAKQMGFDLGGPDEGGGGDGEGGGGGGGGAPKPRSFDAESFTSKNGQMSMNKLNNMFDSKKGRQQMQKLKAQQQPQPQQQQPKPQPQQPKPQPQQPVPQQQPKPKQQPKPQQQQPKPQQQNINKAPNSNQPISPAPNNNSVVKKKNNNLMGKKSNSDFELSRSKYDINNTQNDEFSQMVEMVDLDSKGKMKIQDPEMGTEMVDLDSDGKAKN